MLGGARLAILCKPFFAHAAGEQLQQEDQGSGLTPTGRPRRAAAPQNENNFMNVANCSFTNIVRGRVWWGDPDPAQSKNTASHFAIGMALRMIVFCLDNAAGYCRLVCSCGRFCGNVLRGGCEEGEGHV
jgi:hypothetical protein